MAEYLFLQLTLDLHHSLAFVCLDSIPRDCAMVREVWNCIDSSEKYMVKHLSNMNSLENCSVSVCDRVYSKEMSDFIFLRIPRQKKNASQ